MRILVIKHIECEGPGLWGGFMSKRGIVYDTIELWRGDVLPSIENYSAIMVLGGPMNVYEEDNYPYLAKENELIQNAVTTGIPFAGFCLGGQLLAKALNAPVTKNYTKEIGWFEIQLTSEGKMDRLFEGFDDRFIVYQWHGDTFDIPKGAVKLAESQLCANQCFRYGENAYAFQFHLEVTPKMVEAWTKEYEEELNSLRDLVDAKQMIEEAYKNADSNRNLAKRLFDNFFRLASERL